MKATFEKQNFNERAINEADYVKMFAELGFEAKRVEISFTNGCSAYVTSMVAFKKLIENNVIENA